MACLFGVSTIPAMAPQAAENGRTATAVSIWLLPASLVSHLGKSLRTRTCFSCSCWTTMEVMARPLAEARSQARHSSENMSFIWSNRQIITGPITSRHQVRRPSRSWPPIIDSAWTRTASLFMQEQESNHVISNILAVAPAAPAQVLQTLLHILEIWASKDPLNAAESDWAVQRCSENFSRNRNRRLLMRKF